jgi:flavodoxin
MSYKNLTLFYFSGTGNAKFISEEIEKRAKENGLMTELINIADKSVVILFTYPRV